MTDLDAGLHQVKVEVSDDKSQVKVNYSVSLFIKFTSLDGVTSSGAFSGVILPVDGPSEGNNTEDGAGSSWEEGLDSANQEGAATGDDLSDSPQEGEVDSSSIFGSDSNKNV